MIRSLEQDRAKKAWEFISEIKKEDKKLQKEYKSYVKKAPSLILSNGLGNTLAFWRSKSSKAYEKLYDQINRWFQIKNPGKGENILEWIISEKTSSLEVLKETREVLALLEWMRRFAEAELEGEE